jgi:hypothetical protein
MGSRNDDSGRGGSGGIGRQWGSTSICIGSKRVSCSGRNLGLIWNTGFRHGRWAMGYHSVCSYICLMTKCLKCQKEFTPKRRGGFFCGDSCGNSYRQQLKRNENQKAKLVEKGHAVKNPLTNEELELWRFVTGVAAAAKQILADRNLPDEQRPGDLRSRVNQLVEQCQEKGESQLISEIASRYSAQEEAAKRAEANIKGKHKGK